jgi:hypothetical protein
VWFLFSYYLNYSGLRVTYTPSGCCWWVMG